MALIVGVDAGGTKTTGVVADENGVVLRRARGAGANLHLHGELSVEKVLADLLDELCPEERPDALCLGMAGVDRPGEEQVVRGLLRRLGFRANAQVVNDAVIAIAAGSPNRVGIVLIAGTGSIAYGIDSHGRTARAGGLGPTLADEGSGGWIGHRAVLAAIRAHEGRGPSTALREAVFEDLHVRDLSEFPALAYGGGLTRERFAALAPLVARLAQAGDAEAAGILETGARELAAAARSVAGRLTFGPSGFPLILSGGLFAGLPWYAEAVASLASLPGATPVRLEREPSDGALAMALDLHRSRAKRA
mgnify:FL=1